MQASSLTSASSTRATAPRPQRTRTARLYDPGYTIPDGDPIFRDPELRAEANGDVQRKLYRVAVWVDDDRALVGARLRHELEHVRQWLELGPALFGLYWLLRGHVLEHKARQLRGCGGSYLNAIPSEQDANAASAHYVEKCHSTSGSGCWSPSYTARWSARKSARSQ